jgi:peptide/nickel transport system substrate-binding protein
LSHYGADFRSHPVEQAHSSLNWEENIKLVLRKIIFILKRQYRQSIPYLEAVVVRFTDKQSGFAIPYKEKLDFTSGFRSSYKDEILTQVGELQPKYKNDVNLITGPYLNTNIGFRMDATNPAILNQTHQTGMNYGFDRQSDYLLRNNMRTAAVNGIIPMGLPFNNTKDAYDIEKKKQLVNEYKKLLL